MSWGYYYPYIAKKNWTKSFAGNALQRNMYQGKTSHGYVVILCLTAWFGVIDVVLDAIRVATVCRGVTLCVFYLLSTSILSKLCMYLIFWNEYYGIRCRVMALWVVIAFPKHFMAYTRGFRVSA